MKTRKTLALLLLVAVMTMALVVPAFADTTNTLTVNNALEGETYTAYKLFDLSVNADMTAFTYTVNSAWTSFFADSTNAALITVDTDGYVTDIDDPAALAAACAAALTGKTPAGSDTVATGETAAEISVSDNGYYLITSTAGTIAMADSTPTDPSPEVDEKNPEPTIEKEISSTGKDADEDKFQVGDDVEFTLTVTAYKGALNYVVHDTMDAGLSFNDDIAITGLTEGDDYTVVCPGTSCTDGCTFEIVFAQSYLDTLTGTATEPDEIEITYTAEVLAATVTADQDNDVYLTFGNASETAHDTVTIGTVKFSVHKYATGDDTKALLPNAVFELKCGTTTVALVSDNAYTFHVADSDATTTVTQFTTNGTNEVVINGVDPDKTYTLHEVTAPAGYNVLSTDAAVIFADTGDTVVEVANSAGTELPSTGGMGTTLLVVGGSILFMATALVLVAKKRLYNEG